MLKLLKIPDILYEMTDNYLLIYFSGALGLAVYNMCGGILRAIGDSKRPMYALIAATLINIGLNLLMVLKFNLGVVGVAVATIISQFLSGAYLLYVVTNQIDDVYKVELKHLYIKKECLKEIVYIGLPVGIEKSLLAVSNSLVSAKINWFGPETMAAWGIYRKLDQAVINIPQNIGAAASTFIGQNAGAKKGSRIKSCAVISICMGVGICAVLSTIVILFRSELIKIFDSNVAVLAICSSFVLLLNPLQWISSICHVESGILRGCGDSIGPMIVVCVSYIAIRQLYLQIGWRYFKTGLFVISSFAAGWISGAVIMSIYLAVILKKRIQMIDDLQYSTPQIIE